MSDHHIAAQLAFFLAVLLPLCATGAESPRRIIPTPLPNHPGNIFRFGEQVTIPIPEAASFCRLLDYEDRLLGEIKAAEGRAALGQLPVGYYRLEVPGVSNLISLGVIAALQVPTPTNSPVAIDVAMAWFYEPERMPAVANLCALAGVNWVRDRLNWAEMEPCKGRFASSNRYDASAWAQAQAGLNVLQVMHRSPQWANPETKRFPLDLRDAYRFFEAMARRWRGQVQAFEPWNEADIPMFGGHTGSEMASLQKAAYLGLKAGNPEIIACLNVFALHNPAPLEDLHANEAWPYFDTFNFHHYAPFDQYPKLYADFRAVSAGRPLWVSECSVPVKWAGNPALKEPTDADLKVQSERVAKTFACSLHEGSAATFYFLLPHYVEGQTQFGIVRPDLTPRPAYLALAAVGRLLARAEPLGQVRVTDPTIHAYVFRALPDGRSQDVLVGWTTGTNATLPLSASPESQFDHLGRPSTVGPELRLSSAPVFALLAPGVAKTLSLTPPPAKPPRLGGAPGPIVLQALWPEDKLDLQQSAYRVSGEKTETIPVSAYHFGSRPARGSFRVEPPDGWKATFPTTAQIDPGARVELPLAVTAADAKPGATATVRIRGDFGSEGQPVLSLRLVAAPRPENSH